MAASALTDCRRLAVHTLTNKPWSLAACIDHYQQAGIPAMSIWRNVVWEEEGGVGIDEAATLVRRSDLHVEAYVRGGFFPAADQTGRDRAIDQNRLWVEHALALGAGQLVLVVGAVPGIPLNDQRQMVADGTAALLPLCEPEGLKLSIEPLHPMYAAERSCVNTMGQARSICDRIDHPLVGIACDVYHVWWDERLEDEIALAGEQDRLFAFHICDWRSPTRDFLNDRTLMGEGCIDVPAIRGWVEAAGFDGYNEVEIFSDEYWSTDQSEYLDKIKKAYLERS